MNLNDQKIGNISFLLFFIAASQSATAQTQSPGTFAATGSMVTARAGHSATLLLNGRVLIAGGDQTAFPISQPITAELYDPAAGAFTATGKMTTSRTRHTATLLADGRVLIAGGSPDLSAEIYDPSRGTFEATGNMVASPYSWLQATTLLQDGRVFIAGLPTAQIYDPVVGMFTATSPYAAPPPRYMETATALPDGRVLLTGGNDTSGWTELYDPRIDSFSIAGNMNTWGDVDTATPLITGKVLFIGNGENDGEPADAEIFNPGGATFTRIGSASADHEYAATSLLPDGTVLVTGGQLPGGNGHPVAELYTPATSAFSAAGNMITGRHEHTATLLADGSVLLAGGFNVWPSATASAELYRPTSLGPSPLLFTISGKAKSQGAIWHSATGQIATPDNPALAGEALSMYTTTLLEGGVIPPQVAIGGRLAEILYFGDAPGYPGYNQVNFRVPSSIAPGPSVPGHLTYLSRSSNEVTIGVR